MTSVTERSTPTHPPATGAAYRRFTWQEAIVDYLPAKHRTARAFKWVERIPTMIVLTILGLLALRLRNSAFIDEALYINAGQDYLNQLLHGVQAPDHGQYFSGAPAVYPVLAATLDSFGGLYLVRAFSLLCVMATVVMVQDTAQALFKSRRVGLLAGAAFAFTGPVVFLGAFATFDALCVLSMATALWLGIKHRHWATGVGIGLALTLACTVKYTGAAFVPVVLGIILFAGRHSLRRVGLALVTMAAIITPVMFFYGPGLLPGIEFTTSARKALSPVSHGTLAVYLVLNIALLIAFAALGAGRALLTRPTRGWRMFFITGGLLAGAALLPAAQLRLGEAVSFDKHTAYSSMFLAILAGFGLASISRGLLKLAPVCLLLLVALVGGVSRSGTLYQGWVDLDPVLKVIHQENKPGLYISSSTDALKYYTRKTDPDIHWQTTFALYASKDYGIQQAVTAGRFQMVILRTASTGSAGNDAGQRTLLAALRASPRYELARQPFEVQQYSTDVWLVYRLIPISAYNSDSSGNPDPVTRPTPAPAPTSTPAPLAPVVKVTPAVAKPKPKPYKPVYYNTRGQGLGAATLAAVRRAGHKHQHHTMAKYHISHAMLHKILGTPVKPF